MESSEVSELGDGCGVDWRGISAGSGGISVGEGDGAGDSDGVVACLAVSVLPKPPSFRTVSLRVRRT